MTVREPEGPSSVSHALQVLLLLRQHRSLRVQEVSDLLGLSRSTAHRLLAVLHGHGFVTQDRSRGPYRMGPALVQVGLAALGAIDLRRVAQPVLRALSREVRETVSLIVLEGTEIRFLDSIEGPEDVRVTSRLGQSRPAHCTAGGRVLLAALGRDELLRLYPEETLAPAAPGPVDTRERLLRELDLVRARGYATNFEESTPGLHAVAVPVPVLGHDARPSAAIAISAPAARLGERRAGELVAAALRGAAEIEAALCSAPSPPDA
jgi:IclR family transcriptional regulator, acetate operon repressor